MLDNEASAFSRCFICFLLEIGHYHNEHRSVQKVVSFGVILTLSIIIMSVRRHVIVSEQHEEMIQIIIRIICEILLIK